ncbi:hypothetical protein VNO77_39905 [Canavalia gladiata]|uniref:Uncharacterized protein n=1 Tax=Canavalia gladiata TaxID=3824 RepID=A0AAN9K0U9_CANGL
MRFKERTKRQEKQRLGEGITMQRKRTHAYVTQQIIDFEFLTQAAATPTTTKFEKSHVNGNGGKIPISMEQNSD